jgi:4-alpha-glucanotransferase
MNSVEIDHLHELARLHHLETSFYDGLGAYRQSPPEAIVSVLQSLGVAVTSPGDAPEVLKALRSGRVEEFMEPITVVWKTESSPPFFQCRAAGRLLFRITLESGEEQILEIEPSAGPVGSVQQPEQSFYRLPTDLPWGYHRLEVESDHLRGNTLLIVSPRSAFSRPGDERSWGAFLPLYALVSEANWGAGNFTDLGNLADWVASLGGQFVGTLPLFSAFLKDPLDPSPYAPVSRLFWNEFFVDPTRTPEWDLSDRARELYNSSTFQEELRTQRESRWVDYKNQMRTKRQVLEVLAHQFFTHDGVKLSEFRQFLAEDPPVEDYAAFRAVQEHLSQPWGNWPDRMRDGVLLESDYESQVRDYHLYVQWVAGRQMKSIQQPARDKFFGLYLDLPLGVHPDGYDVWRNQELFAPRVSGGAPPDSFFTNGQDWGFRPLHPQASRSQHHSYFRKILCHLMRNADLLRIDHVMSMHRLYWVPSGFRAADGVYVHYPWEELYAILTLESHRQQCVVVGEDLGTVPPIIRDSMADHGIHRMYVSIFEVDAASHPPINAPTSDVLAGLNTHDTATFAAFWRGLDIEERRKMGLLDDQSCMKERSSRAELVHSILEHSGIEGDPKSDDVQSRVLRELLLELSRSEADYLLINLEDLWLETVSQNVPGTGPEKPNWRHKTRFGFEHFSNSPEITMILGEIDRVRRPAKDLGKERG